MKQMHLFAEYEKNFNYKEIENIKQVYHPWHLWEDYRYGFYDNISGKNKIQMIQDVIDFFNNEKLIHEYMNKVIKQWKYSCEHNFTNPSINKIAYLGQASLSLYKKIPSTVTMESWSKLQPEKQQIADKIADYYINEWFKNYTLCLKKD